MKGHFETEVNFHICVANYEFKNKYMSDIAADIQGILRTNTGDYEAGDSFDSLSFIIDQAYVYDEIKEEVLSPEMTEEFLAEEKDYILDEANINSPAFYLWNIKNDTVDLSGETPGDGL